MTEKQKWFCMEISISGQGKMAKKYSYADSVEKDNLMQYVEDYENKLNKKYV